MAHVERFIDRFRYKASKARQAQSRLKALAKMEPIAAVVEERGIEFQFPEPEELAPPLIVMDHVAVGYEPGKPVLSRINLRLDPDERIVIERASVVGKEFPQEALVGLADPEEDGTSLARNLERLIRRDLIRPAPTVLGRGEGFRLRHNLIRDAAYTGIPKRVRALLHERFATWLEEGSDRGPGEHEEIVGYHLEQAALLLDSTNPPTAIFCGTDRMAMGAYDAIKERGLTIPSDVAVVGFDDIPVAARVARLAGLAVLFEQLGGSDLAAHAVKQRAGGMLDPSLAARFSDHAAEWLADLAATDSLLGVLHELVAIRTATSR